MKKTEAEIKKEVEKLEKEAAKFIDDLDEGGHAFRVVKLKKLTPPNL